MPDNSSFLKASVGLLQKFNFLKFFNVNKLANGTSRPRTCNPIKERQGTLETTADTKALGGLSKSRKFYPIKCITALVIMNMNLKFVEDPENTLHSSNSGSMYTNRRWDASTYCQSCTPHKSPTYSGQSSSSRRKSMSPCGEKKGRRQ